MPINSVEATRSTVCSHGKLSTKSELLTFAIWTM